MNSWLSRRSKASRWTAPGAVLVLAAVLAATAANAGSAGAAPPARAKDQTLVVQQLKSTGVAPLLDPAFLEFDGDWTIVSNLFQTLTTVTPKGKVLPALATSWSNRGAVWTFDLRHDARFSDGTPLTARDVSYSLRRALTPITADQMRALGVTTPTPHGFTVLPDVLGAAAVQAGSAKAIPANAISAPNKYTVRITLEKPRSDLPVRLANPSLGIVKRSNVTSSAGSGPWWYKPVSSGPFKVARYVPNTSASLVPNKYYFGPKPILQHVEFKVVGDTQTAEIAYEAKSLDVVKTTYSDVLGLETRGYRSQLRSVLGANVSVGIVNFNVAPTDDPHVARALAMAIDKRTLAKQVLDNLVTPAETFTPPFFPGYSSKGFQPLKFDPAAAKAELARSKYGSNISIRVWTSSSQDPRAIQALAQMWQQNLGIKVQIQTSLSPAAASKDQAANVILASQGPAFIAPCSMMQRWADFVAAFANGSNVNFGPVNPPQLNTRLAACYAASPSKTWSSVMAVENLMTQYPQFIPINYNRDYYLVQPYVRRIAFGPLWNIRNLSRVWIAAH